MSEREEIMNLIRNEYDPAPSHYRMGDDWDDGAGRIADAILADRALLLRKHTEEIERLRGAAQRAPDLLKYANHLTNCRYRGGHDCDCGLDEIRASSKEGK